VQDEMKRYSANRGIIVSTSGFSPSAMQYALTRPIDLIDRRQLSQSLHKIGK
jgi:restriction endonuclease Mrr